MEAWYSCLGCFFQFYKIKDKKDIEQYLDKQPLLYLGNRDLQPLNSQRTNTNATNFQIVDFELWVSSKWL